MTIGEHCFQVFHLSLSSMRTVFILIMRPTFSDNGLDENGGGLYCKRMIWKEKLTYNTEDWRYLFCENRREHNEGKRNSSHKTLKLTELKMLLLYSIGRL